MKYIILSLGFILNTLYAQTFDLSDPFKDVTMDAAKVCNTDGISKYEDIEDKIIDLDNAGYTKSEDFFKLACLLMLNYDLKGFDATNDLLEKLVNLLDADGNYFTIDDSNKPTIVINVIYDEVIYNYIDANTYDIILYNFIYLDTFGSTADERTSVKEKFYIKFDEFYANGKNKLPPLPEDELVVEAIDKVKDYLLKADPALLESITKKDFEDLGDLKDATDDTILKNLITLIEEAFDNNYDKTEKKLNEEEFLAAISGKISESYKNTVKKLLDVLTVKAKALELANDENLVDASEITDILNENKTLVDKIIWKSTTPPPVSQQRTPYTQSPWFYYLNGLFKPTNNQNFFYTNANSYNNAQSHGLITNGVSHQNYYNAYLMLASENKGFGYGLDANQKPYTYILPDGTFTSNFDFTSSANSRVNKKATPYSSLNMVRFGPSNFFNSTGNLRGVDYANSSYLKMLDGI